MRAAEASVDADLAAWLERLAAIHPREMELGLDRVRAVADRLGLTAPAPVVVTVAGTNGKGSAVAVVDAVLAAAGVRTGCTVSPHLSRFNERILVDGAEAGDAAITGAFARIEAARKRDPEISLTYFEFAILAALLLIGEAAVDVAVLEVGLGGRLDAVNVVDADVAVITPVDLDHQEWLGDDREAIGAEKAGILRRGRPVVLGDRDPPASVLAAAAELQAPVLAIGEDFDLEGTAGGRFFHGRTEEGTAVRIGPLPEPSVHPDAVATGLQAAVLAGWDPRADVAGRALADLVVPGRTETLVWPAPAPGDIEVPVLIDVAHNPHAARALAGRLGGETPRHAVLGTFADKDARAMVTALAGRIASIEFVPTAGGRARTAQALAAHCAPATAGLPVACHDSVLAGLEAAVARGRASGAGVLVLGSFTVVGRARDAVLARRAGTAAVRRAGDAAR